MTFYFTLEEALRIVELERIGPVADAGLLDAALARPAASAFGEDAYPTLELKAGALLQSLVKDYPLVDGNKRLGWLLTEMFVELNDAVCELDDEQVFALVMDVAAGVATALPDIAKRLGIGLA